MILVRLLIVLARGDTNIIWAHIGEPAGHAQHTHTHTGAESRLVPKAHPPKATAAGSHLYTIQAAAEQPREKKSQVGERVCCRW